MPNAPELSDDVIARLRQLDDADLLRECDVQAFRGAGPGGQKKNKTSSGIRLVHAASGCSAIATERRSKQQNLDHALRRLRLEIALSHRCREPVDALQLVGANHADFPRRVGELFDALYQNLYSLRDTAAACGTSTAQLNRMICADARVLAALNALRRQRGLKPLREGD